MQVPASNLYPNRFHRLVGYCRAEIDEELPLAILRSPRPKCIAQKIELLVRIRTSPILILLKNTTTPALPWPERAGSRALWLGFAAQPPFAFEFPHRGVRELFHRKLRAP